MALPGDGVILDVGNGLGTQDPLIAETVRPRRLVAVNITEWQLAAAGPGCGRPLPRRWRATPPGCRLPPGPSMG